MKFCYKGDELAGLRQYRDANPENRWENFRQECQSGLTEVYEHLHQDQGGLCVYCELSVSGDNRQVEHFHDKSDESDAVSPTKWHLAWDNMRYACKGGTGQNSDPNVFMEPVKENLSCGQAKGNGVYQNILAPDDIPLFPNIFRYERKEKAVTIHPDEERCREAKIDIARAQRTIDELNLNCPRLCQSRLAYWMPLEEILIKHRPNTQEKIRLASILLGDAQREKRRSFFSMIRSILKESAEEYLHDIGYNG